MGRNEPALRALGSLREKLRREALRAQHLRIDVYRDALEVAGFAVASHGDAHSGRVALHESDDLGDVFRCAFVHRHERVGEPALSLHVRGEPLQLLAPEALQLVLVDRLAERPRTERIARDVRTDAAVEAERHVFVEQPVVRVIDHRVVGVCALVIPRQVHDRHGDRLLSGGRQQLVHWLHRLVMLL